MNEKNGVQGTHGFEMPVHVPASYETISVGIFEWVAKSSRKGTKRGKSKVRVRGYASHPEDVEAEARRIVALLDSGQWIGKKTVDLTKKG